LLLHEVETFLDLVLIGHKQRATPLECDFDLHTREPARPPVNNPADRTRDTAELKHEDVDRRVA
jgi:hypothetical protein